MTKRRRSTQRNDNGSSSENRRERIADAALQILATQGARGLTHRAIDRDLELADGSTSYYYRTRATLLLAAAQRLVELDGADVEDLPESSEGTAQLVVRWTSAERRARSLARLELLLTAARDPAFRFMKDARETFVARVARGERSASRSDARISGSRWSRSPTAWCCTACWPARSAVRTRGARSSACAARTAPSARPTQISPRQRDRDPVAVLGYVERRQEAREKRELVVAVP